MVELIAFSFPLEPGAEIASFETAPEKTAPPQDERLCE
jgi:hypothetical protein